jgi:hypothetical protein
MAESPTSSKGRDMKMMSGWLAAILGGAASIILSAQSPAPHRECARLTSLTLPDIKIGEAVAVPALFGLLEWRPTGLDGSAALSRRLRRDRRRGARSTHLTGSLPRLMIRRRNRIHVGPGIRYPV